MLHHYTAVYTAIESGYMSQLAQWPEVITEGATLPECRTMLEDTLNEMIAARKQLGEEIPPGSGLLERIAKP